MLHKTSGGLPFASPNKLPSFRSHPINLLGSGNGDWPSTSLNSLNLSSLLQGLSVQKAAAISAAFVEDGCARKAARQLASSSRQRDFWRWVKLPWKQYVVKLPLLAKGTKDRRVVEEDVAINLPSDFIHEMHHHLAFYVSIFGPGGEGSLAQYWQGEDEEWLERIGLQETDFATTIPLFFHEDGVPSFKDESFCFWSWSALSELGSWQSRTCV